MDPVGIKKIRDFYITLSRNLTTYRTDVLKITTKDGVDERKSAQSIKGIEFIKNPSTKKTPDSDGEFY